MRRLFPVLMYELRSPHFISAKFVEYVIFADQRE